MNWKVPMRLDAIRHRTTLIFCTALLLGCVNDQPVEPVDDAPPPVTFDVASRVEVFDSITVSASLPAGVKRMGWVATDLSGNTVLGGDSTEGSGELTDLTRTYGLNFEFTDFPRKLLVQAFAVDADGNREETGEAETPAFSLLGSVAGNFAAAALVRDTITVVNGVTKSLPAGGRIADAIYNRNLDEVYLTNVDLNRVEVFHIGDTSFVDAIDVGARPWGIALWPLDTLGANADTVIVANSGGTNFSVVDVAARRETRRHELPNVIVQTVQTEIDEATQIIKIKVEEYDFADRPQYVGAVCRPAGDAATPTGATACEPDSIFVVYSTAPTDGQTSDFQFRGTVRWENLTAAATTPFSHFFWEHAAVPPSPDFDSLQVLADRGPCTAPDPRSACAGQPTSFNPIDTLLSVAKGVVADIEQLAFRDTTFVRNSGNFTRAIVGEGTRVDEARAMAWNGNARLIQTVDMTTVAGQTISGPSTVDEGVTAGVKVRDFISNTATRIRSVAINFNGLTNLVRADSVYVVDKDLRLAGLVPVGGANPGMDLNFDHAFDPMVGGTAGTSGGPLDPDERILFLAREDASVDVYDTYFFKIITTIPVRDPITGPLRAARLPSGDQIIVGVTTNGIVTVRFPQIPNIFPAPGP